MKKLISLIICIAIIFCNTLVFCATTQITATINVPKGASVQVLKQINNFNTEEIMPKSVDVSGEKDIYKFSVDKSSTNYTYKVSKSGKMTEGGFLSLTNETTATVDVEFNDKPCDYRYDYTENSNLTSIAEDNLILNVNNQNYLKLKTGEEFKIRAYRAWQIINNTSGNIMIEPDFHYSIISGESISLKQDNSKSQWAEITALKEGVSVIKVTYDAINISGNTNFKGIYGACDNSRCGIIIVNVTNTDSSNITLPEWDSDFNTFYFTTEYGLFNYKPISNKPLSVTCNNEEIKKEADGSFNLKIKDGNNIVHIFNDDCEEYVVIKGKKIEIKINNLTTPGKKIKQGDDVQIDFNKLYSPVPKFSGIYNPGYGATVKASYENNNSIINSKGCQYDFATKNSLKFKVFEKGIFNGINGKITGTLMGNALGSHRNVTDSGVPANLDAAEGSFVFYNLPNFSFEVYENENKSYLEENYYSFCDLDNASIMYGINTFQNSFSLTKSKTSVKYTSINSAYSLNVTVNPVNINTSTEINIWQDYDKIYNYKLINGEINNLDFVPNISKPIYMDLIVKPKNELLGKSKTYSYLVYTSTTNNVLKTLEINGCKLQSDYGEGFKLSKNEYYCYVPEDETTVNITTARLIGSGSININGESKTVGTKSTVFENVKLTGKETDIIINLSDEKIYKIKVIKTDKPIISDINVIDDVLCFNAFSVNNEGFDIFLRDEDIIKRGIELKTGNNRICFDVKNNSNNAKMFIFNENIQPLIESVCLGDYIK